MATTATALWRKKVPASLRRSKKGFKASKKGNDSGIGAAATTQERNDSYTGKERISESENDNSHDSRQGQCSKKDRTT